MSKPGRPNLFLAGKREAPVQQKQTRGGASNRGAGRGRGGRGGRGGAGGRPRQEIIQTGGVFSHGLGGEFPTKKRDKDYDASQFAYKRDRESGDPSTSDEKKEEIKVEGKASFEGYDALWRSDDEGDEAELRALHPKGQFVSDLRRGHVMPVVLPVDDQSQFLNIINKSARLSLEEDNEIIEEEKKPSQNTVDNTAQKRTAQQLITMLESSTTDLLHLQLPSVIDDPDSEIPPGIPKAPAPPSGLPQRQRIGKLQVTKKGRLILQIGGHSIDITTKPISEKQQGTVLLEADPAADQVQAPSPFAQPSTIENSLYHLGNVKHNLVGSMAWGGLSEKMEEEEEERKKLKKTTIEDGDVTITDGDREKIESLEREQAKWAVMAAKWASGLSTS
ncbi:hypothetical protein L3Y34_014839 [Caenorhabditis briggsae]|uniref:Uncharacterized protein n=1 Tax=Caenorhabditis briggsae TaxID=6238 RepID=A0AAE9IYC3_CAEBR|nr:hypothetical protein L3Y34_014839 [Caenorhabditis briggsae]